jgi:hypothetical protein
MKVIPETHRGFYDTVYSRAIAINFRRHLLKFTYNDAPSDFELTMTKFQM